MSGEVVSYSCRAAPHKDWPASLNEDLGDIGLGWVAIEVDAKKHAIVVSDDEGGRIYLDCSKALRPSGEFVSPGWKVALGFLRVAKEMGFSVVVGERNVTLNLADVPSIRSELGSDVSLAEFEDHAFAIRLVPRVFRLRQLGDAQAGVDVSL
jgi:hypothetical protein